MTDKFVYELAGLQRVQDYQIDQLVTQLAELKDSMSSKQNEISDLGASIEEHEWTLNRLLKEQPLFWLESREATRSYLAKLRSDKQHAAVELDKLTAQAVQVMMDVVDAQRARRLIEKHKGRKFELHTRSTERKHGLLMDEFVMRRSAMMQQRKQSA